MTITEQLAEALGMVCLMVQRTVDPVPTHMSDRRTLDWVNGQSRLLESKLLAAYEASKARWKCACGWQGNPEQMTANPSGHLCCPECGGSGGLVSKPALEQATTEHELLGSQTDIRGNRTWGLLKP